MPGGRPTKYNKEILEKSNYYLENFEEYGDKIPSIIGLSLVLDVSDETIQNWRKQKDKKEFFGILEKISKKQHQVLINKGLDGDFNANICKLVLGKHGYHDKQDTTLGGSGGGPIEIKETTFRLIRPKDKK